MYVKEHHRIHHKYMQQNLNVFFPLADRVLARTAARPAWPPSRKPPFPRTRRPRPPPAPRLLPRHSVSKRDREAVGAEK